MAHDHHHEKTQVALWSMLASASLTFVKLVAALVSGSLGLLSETFHSFFDFIATALTLFAVRISGRPADEDHHFGHAKIESVVALVETGLLILVTVWVVYEAITRLVFGGHELELSWWLFAVVIGSIIIDFNRARALQHTADKTGSDALSADALHFRADMWSSTAVLAGLALSWFGFHAADPLAALLVAGFVAKAAFDLGSQTLGNLLDQAPSGSSEKIREIAEGVNGVLAVNQLRVRPSGALLFVDLTADVPRTLGATATDNIRRALVESISAAFNKADVTVQLNAVQLDSETAFDKVELIAAQHRLSVHHLTVQDLEGRLAVSFDLEIDGNTPLSVAHDRATSLEAAIREGLGNNVEVESHIEPQDAMLLVGAAADGKTAARISGKLGALCKKEKPLSDLHNIRVRKNSAGLYVHYHCRFKPHLTISAIHAIVDRIENALIKFEPKISRVVAHAEPLGSERHRL